MMTPTDHMSRERLYPLLFSTSGATKQLHQSYHFQRCSPQGQNALALRPNFYGFGRGTDGLGLKSCATFLWHHPQTQALTTTAKPSSKVIT